MGIVLLSIGIVGSIVSIVMICVLEQNWKEKRKRLLKQIETEESVR